MFIINFILSLFALLLLLITMVLFVQVVFAVISKILAKSNAKQTTDKSKKRPNVAVIVPAHNEALGIQKTLTSIKSQLNSEDMLVVVADNCNDGTAEIAKTEGAITLERFDTLKRGKGYALDYAMKYLAKSPPTLVFIVDADCTLSDNFISEVSDLCLTKKRPIQANYEMMFEKRENIKQQLIEFAWTLKNKIRPLGFQYLGLPCQLMGTGMAFLWEDLEKCNLSTGHIVEDMKLGTDLAKLNKSPLFCDTATVSSFFPTTDAGLATQRTRWEHGHISVILSEVPKLIQISLRERSLQGFTQALDLSIPPLAFLFILSIVVWLASLLILLMFGYINALLISTASILMLGVSIFLAWLYYGRNIISLIAIAFSPFIILKKLPIYIKFIFNREVNWVRSKRD